MTECKVATGTSSHRPEFIALIGPTAVGKTDLALHLARELPLEIVNADSRQIYRYMDIGTSKPTPDQRSCVPHHMYDIVDPDEDYSLAMYQEQASRALADIGARGYIPLLVGGTGQYIWAMVEGWQVPEVPPDEDFRQDMNQWANQHGLTSLHKRLESIDPEAAAMIAERNVRRVIRALELHRATGEKPSLLLRRRSEVARHSLVLGLSIDRDILRGRADARIDTMVQQGFPSEVKALLDRGYGSTLPALSSIGYREMVECVTGRIDLATAKARIRRETHRLIRRQFTWFRPGDARITWLDATDPASTVAEANRKIAGALE